MNRTVPADAAIRELEAWTTTIAAYLSNDRMGARANLELARAVEHQKAIEKVALPPDLRRDYNAASLRLAELVLLAASDKVRPAWVAAADRYRAGLSEVTT